MRIVDVALLFIMLALGLNIVVGYAGLLDLGYIAFFAVGAYAYALLASPQFDIHWSFLALLPLGALVAAFFGVLLGAPTLQAARRLPRDRDARLRRDHPHLPEQPEPPVQHHQRPAGHHADRPAADRRREPRARRITIGGLTIAPVHSYYFVFLACARRRRSSSRVRLEDSRIGRAWVAIREDELAAAAMGINTRNVKLLAFAMGATFGGVAGGLFASFQGFISPESFTLLDSIMVLCMVVLGGMGNVGGRRARRGAADRAARGAAPRRRRCSRTGSARSTSTRRTCACCSSGSRSCS